MTNIFKDHTVRTNSKIKYMYQNRRKKANANFPGPVQTLKKNSDKGLN